MAPELRERALALVRSRYADFGPTLAHEKLVELHRLPLSVGTLRTWMIADGIWTTRRAHNAHRPLRAHEKLEQVFTWQEERRVTGNLTLH